MREIEKLRKEICELRKYLSDNPMPPTTVDNEWSRTGYRNAKSKLMDMERYLSILMERDSTCR